MKTTSEMGNHPLLIFRRAIIAIKGEKDFQTQLQDIVHQQVNSLTLIMRMEDKRQARLKKCG
jgi:hypothetical protein